MLRGIPKAAHAVYGGIGRNCAALLQKLTPGNHCAICKHIFTFFGFDTFPVNVLREKK